LFVLSLFLGVIFKKILINFVLFCLSFGGFIFCFPLTENFFASSQFIEKNYQYPVFQKTAEKPKNIILIYLESVDSSFFKQEELMPYLHQLEQKNLSFKNYIPLYGTNWTISSLTSLTTGIPFKASYFISSPDVFLKKAPSVFDVLKRENYDISFMLCGEKFTNKKNFFSDDGTYLAKRQLLRKARTDKRYLPQEDFNFFCFDDKDTFRIAQIEIEQKVKNNRPFFFWLESIETHVPGLLSSNCPVVYNDIRDSYHCSDIIIKEFITWLQKQDFYKDTLIVLMGDHLLPTADETGKYILNVLLNSDKTTFSEDKPYTILDMGPTILTAAGIEIDHLGLGTSLFSDKQTLVEKYDLDFIETEIKKKSSFYENFCTD